MQATHFTKADRIATLFRIQVKEFYRDFGTVFLSFVFPLMFVVALIITNLMDPVVKFKFGIVDDNHNPQTPSFVDILSSSPSIEARSVSRAKGFEDLKDGNLHA